MEKKTKIFVGIGIALISAVGIYVGVTSFLKKKPKEDESPELPKTETEPGSGSAPQGSGIVIKKPETKPTGFDKKPVPYNPKTVVTKPVVKAPAKPAAKPAAGKKMYVYAKTDGVNVYKKSTQAGAVIGDKYNTFDKGKIIGTYAGSVSVRGEKYTRVMDGKNAVLVSEKLIYTKTI